MRGRIKDAQFLQRVNVQSGSYLFVEKSHNILKIYGLRHVSEGTPGRVINLQKETI